jgi:CDP-4-dehydro-6-deoxyglucose reductase
MPVVTVYPSGEVIYLDPGETVLSGLYKAGYAYAVGCRRGGCAVCKVDCLRGQFDYNHPVAETVLTVDERAGGTCLTCRAVPEGDITVEMRNEDLRLINPFLRQLNEKARLLAESVFTGTESKE